MLSKNEIKDIQSLTHKKFRDALNLFVAEGPKMVTELIQIIPSQIQTVYATATWINNNSVAKNINLVEVSEVELSRLSQLKTPNSVIALIKKFESKEPVASSLTIYLDAIQDPGNLGTIIRTADWFGVKNIVCSIGCADLYNSKVVQSTMASIASVNVFYDEEGVWLAKQNVPVYAAVLDGQSLFENAKIDKGILVIGNESMGISEAVLQFATHKITIPKRGNAESLNAAVATGIILAQVI